MLPDLLINVAIYLSVVYFLIQLRNFLIAKINAILDYYYPVFSYDKIRWYKKLHEEHERETDKLNKRSSRLRDGEEMQGIFPSKTYLQLLEDQGRAFGLSATYLKRYSLMREANYKVFNGKTIEETKKKYDKEIVKFCGALPGRGQIGKEYEEFYKRLGDLYTKYRGSKSKEIFKRELELEKEIFKSRYGT